MPEQITKYPDVTLRVLEGAGGQCGEGVKPKILTKCPPERFCSFPSGEICVYGINDIPKMTQIKPRELAKVVCPREKPTSHGSLQGPDLVVFGAVFLLGWAFTGLWRGIRTP